MKKLLCLVLPLLLLGCSRAAAGEAPLLFDEIEDYMEQNGFVEADDDFWENNFSMAEEIEDGEIFLSKNSKSASQFGFFRLSDAAHRAAFETEVREYLENEKNAAAELGRLYPEGGLEKELAKYERAKVWGHGQYVLFAVYDEQDERNLRDWAEKLLNEKG